MLLLPSFNLENFSQAVFSSSVSTFSKPISKATVSQCENISFHNHLAKREVYPQRRAVHILARDTKTDNDINVFAQSNFFRRYKAQQDNYSSKIKQNMKLFTISFAFLGASASFNPFVRGKIYFILYF